MDLGANEALEQHSKKVLSQLPEVFKQVQDINKDLLNNVDIQNMGRYYTHLDKLTGLYASLIVEFKQISAYKENKEMEFFNELLLTANYNNEKFVAETSKREASLYVSPLRMARDIIDGHLQACTMAIATCKARIYASKEEKKYDI